MSEAAPRSHAAKEKKPIEILRERVGGASRELVERNRRQTADRRRIIDALKAAPKTAPEIAKETGLPPHEVFWHLMAMKKYGKVVEGAEREDYFEYALPEASEGKGTES
ncbi:MAG: MarR family transcriptional regulator [Thermogutta sp.]|nr:MarR family transcriptional regulator [Thermogutta sp.]